MTRSCASRNGGMTLLEMLVAVAIMAMALGMLYRSMGGSARAAGQAALHQEATFIAESLVFANTSLPEEGWDEEGQSGIFHWAVQTRRYPTPTEQSHPNAVPLHELSVVVSWGDQGHQQNVRLQTLVPYRASVVGGRRAAR